MKYILLHIVHSRNDYKRIASVDGIKDKIRPFKQLKIKSAWFNFITQSLQGMGNIRRKYVKQEIII